MTEGEPMGVRLEAAEKLAALGQGVRQRQLARLRSEVRRQGERLDAIEARVRAVEERPS